MTHTNTTRLVATKPRRGIIRSSLAHMPASCKFGRYRRVGLLIVTDDVVRASDVRMLSTRARGVVDIVDIYERQSVGTMVRSAYVDAVRALRQRANDENITIVDDDTGVAP